MTTNPIGASAFFDTPTTYEDLLEWCKLHNGGERVIAITAAHMALNLAHYIIENTLQAQQTSQRS